MSGISKIFRDEPYGIPRGQGWDLRILLKRDDFTLDLIIGYLEKLESQRPEDQFQLPAINMYHLAGSPNFSFDLIKLFPKGLPDGRGSYESWKDSPSFQSFFPDLEYIYQNPEGIKGEEWNIHTLFGLYEKEKLRLESDGLLSKDGANTESSFAKLIIKTGNFAQFLEHFSQDDGPDEVIGGGLADVMSKITPVEQILERPEGFLFRGKRGCWKMSKICKDNKTLNEKFIEDRPEGLNIVNSKSQAVLKPWKVEELLKNDNISLDFLRRNIDMFSDLEDPMNVISSWSKLDFNFFLENPEGLKIGSKIRPWYMPAISGRSDLVTPDLVRSNPNKPWNYDGLSMNDNIDEDFVEEHLEEFKKHWSALIRNPNISLDFIDKHLDKIDFTGNDASYWLSVSDKLTFDFFLKHFEWSPKKGRYLELISSDLGKGLASMIQRGYLNEHEVKIFREGNKLVHDEFLELILVYTNLKEGPLEVNELLSELLYSYIMSELFDRVQEDGIRQKYTMYCPVDQIIDRPEGFVVKMKQIINTEIYNPGSEGKKWKLDEIFEIEEIEFCWDQSALAQRDWSGMLGVGVNAKSAAKNSDLES